jgi:hypothetical protein
MKKIIGIFVCMLLILTAISATGRIMDNSIRINNEHIAKPLSDDKWMVTYGGNLLDFGIEAIQTPDGGYIVVGATCSFGSIGEDVWLIKTDSQGQLEWEKFYGGIGRDFGSDVKITSDGGYIITGSTGSYGNGKQDVWLIKTDENGEMLWDKTFGGVEWDHGNELLITSDGGYLIIADSEHTGGPSGKAWLIKTDSAGNKLWDKIFGPVGHNSGNSIDFTSDGGIIIIGSSYVPGETDSYDAWLIKTDIDGNKLWDKKFEGTDFGSDIQETSDGGFIIIGTLNYEHPISKIWLAKTDSNGDIIWDKIIDKFAEDQRGMSVRQTSDGGFIIVGESLLDNPYGFCPIIFKTNNAGDEEWNHFLKEFGNDVLFSVEITDDEGYIFTGYTHSKLNQDLWLIKATSNGDIPTNHANFHFRYRLFNLFPNLVKIFQKIFG